MNQALKQRLVGALVLVALAVIFLPSLFNGGRPKPIDMMQGIAPMPAAEPPLVVEEPVHPQGLPAEEPGKGNAKDMFALDNADSKVPGQPPAPEAAPAPAAAPEAPATAPETAADKAPETAAQPVAVEKTSGKQVDARVVVPALPPAVAVSNASAPAGDPPALKSNGLPQAWALQVGVFSDKSKADALKASLQAKGYRAFTRTQIHDQKIVTRVLIGPEAQQSAIAKTKAKVDKALSSKKSMIVKFES
jgi:DedD protein